MAIQELPSTIQSMFCAAKHITSYKRAVEELIYNALDAGSTSIAVRIHIAQNSLQILDNGCGINRNDFKLLGQRYATSKCVDLSSLKSAPDKYGFRGQSLANIIDVSEEVKITSKCQSVEATWVKLFINGKPNKLTKTTERPSKGTTVDINGFLYNQNLRRKAIDHIHELNEIKTFLEQLSLVHNNVSVSLRDDVKNEITFKLHKKRDIYQTLSSIFGINKTDIKEFKVEKNNYKVTAIISKQEKENKKYNLIYLNGKIVNNSKLYKVVNDNFMKSLRIKFQSMKRCKIKNNFEDDNLCSNNKIPCYFIFLTCPYIDYDVSYTPKQAILEFKNWELITKIIQKLVKFYAGDDINLKPIIHNNVKDNNSEETRDQVKKIIEKILGSNSKKPGVSQMRNGVKGKPIKRKLVKRKLKGKKINLSLSKVLPLKSIKTVDNNIKDVANNTLEVSDEEVLDNAKIEINVKNDKQNYNCEELNSNEHDNTSMATNNNTNKNIERKKIKSKTEKTAEIKNHFENSKKNKHKNNKASCNKIQTKTRINRKHKLDPLAKKFKNSLITESIKRRCEEVATKVKEHMKHKNKVNYKISINERVEYSSIIKNNKNMSVGQKVDEIVIQNYKNTVPLEFLPCTFDNRVWDGLKKTLSSSDLLQTVLNSQSGKKRDVANIPTPKRCNKFIKSTDRKNYEISDNAQYRQLHSMHRLTYESHKYQENNITPSKSSTEIGDYESTCERNVRRHFITKLYKDNFISSKKTQKYYGNIKRSKRSYCKSNKLYDKKSTPFCNGNQAWLDPSYSIDFSENTKAGTYCPQTIEDNSTCHQSLFPVGSDNRQFGTYTIDKEDERPLYINSPKTCSTYTVFSNTYHSFNGRKNNTSKDTHENIEHCEIGGTYTVEEPETDIDRPNFNSNDDNMIKKCNINVVFLSKSQEENHSCNTNIEIDPLNLCETEMHSHEIFEKNYQFNYYESQPNDIVFQTDISVASVLCDRNIYSSNEKSILCQTVEKKQSLETISHHFDDLNTVTNNIRNNDIKMCNENINFTTHKNSQEYSKFDDNNEQTNTLIISENNIDPIWNTTSFHVKSRPRFIPKGLSQIFENCQTKSGGIYNIEEEYYGDEIYSNFVDNVESNAGIFETKMENLNDLTTKDLQKVTRRLKKENTALTFCGTSLKYAVVLGQIDDKFIAAKLKSKSNNEHLVLFDQHAVDERIRLEKNLADYLNYNQWKSITLDDVISLKLTEDEILYLHNYRHKFAQFGLQWVISESHEVVIDTIPEAILGKTPRQVEIVMNAVKNLILEEIQAMKSQKGCVTMYPKSIMDLVFSEACRYAIKFGDKLSTGACIELLLRLSECKTPFQCAHGRPVMAVLIDLNNYKPKYSANTTKIQEFVNRVIKCK